LRCWSIHLKAETDLLLTDTSRVGNVLASAAIVPGSTLRGALASFHAPPPGAVPTADFLAAFFSPQVVFTDAYPTNPRNYRDAVAVPLSATTCNLSRGFLHDPGGHGVYDRFTREHSRCQLCEQPMEAYRGLVYPPDQGGAPRACQVGLIQRPHNEIGAEGRTRDAALFTELRLPRGTVLHGEIRLAAPVALLEDWLDGGPRVLPLGRRGGRARATFTLDEDWRPEGIEDLDEGIDSVRLVLTSPAILEDGFGRSLRRFDDLALAALAGRAPWDTGLELFEQFSALRQVGGWNAAHRLPKTVDLALDRGSCGFFLVTDLVKARQTLESLLTFGGGARTWEGFGQVALLGSDIFDG